MGHYESIRAINMPKGDKLTGKQQIFCDEYCTNGFNASQAYKTAYPKSKRNWDSLGHENMVKPCIINEINRQKAEIKANTVASRTVRQKFWSDMMQDNDTPKQERLRASELLGRSEADFTDNISNTVPDQTETLTKEQQIEALRAQIRLLTEADDAGTAIAV